MINFSNFKLKNFLFYFKCQILSYFYLFIKVLIILKILLFLFLFFFFFYFMNIISIYVQKMILKPNASKIKKYILYIFLIFISLTICFRLNINSQPTTSDHNLKVKSFDKPNQIRLFETISKFSRMQ